MNLDEKRLHDTEQALMSAYDALLNNNIKLAKQILHDQIEKTYDA